MAAACGITIANIYYAQPLLSEIARTFNVSQTDIGVAAMLTQAGYAMGMLFLLPLGDIRERRSLIIFMLYTAAGALILMAISFNIAMLFFAAFFVGFVSIVPQLIVPFAANLALPEERGKVIGNVMSGLFPYRSNDFCSLQYILDISCVFIRKPCVSTRCPGSRYVWISWSGWSINCISSRKDIR